MSVWFDGSQQIDCSIEDVKRALQDPGDLYAGVVRHMPGMTSVEVLERSAGSVIIQTNEGTMTRTAITVNLDHDPVTLDVDEEYQAGTSVTTTAHFRDEFTPHRHRRQPPPDHQRSHSLRGAGVLLPPPRKRQDGQRLPHRIRDTPPRHQHLAAAHQPSRSRTLAQISPTLPIAAGMTGVRHARTHPVFIGVRSDTGSRRRRRDRGWSG